MELTQAQILNLCGWRPDWPAIARQTAAMMPYKSAAPQHMHNGAATQASGLLWEDVVAVRGSMIPAHTQSIGSCLGHGWSLALDILQCCDIRRRQKHQRWRSTSHGGIYALSREKAGLLGGGDGSYGAAAAWSCQNWGDVSDQDCGETDSDDRLASEWGRRGMPSNMKQLALPHVCRQMNTCTTAEEAAGAILDGRPIPVCSDVAFVMTRDQQGYCRRDTSTSWPHCMCIAGYDPSLRRFCIFQSWGPNVPGGPTYLGQPDNSFWADWDTVHAMLRQGDSYVPGLFEGWNGEPTPPVPPGPTPSTCLSLGCSLPAGTYAITKERPGCFPRVLCTISGGADMPAGNYCLTSRSRDVSPEASNDGGGAGQELATLGRYLRAFLQRCFPE